MGEIAFVFDRHQLYNKYKRNKEVKKFYNSREWEVCRTKVLIRCYYLCQECLSRKRIKVYDVVHHIKPLLDHPELALAEDNLIALCHACHNRIESEQGYVTKGINFVEVEGNEEIV